MRLLRIFTIELSLFQLIFNDEEPVRAEDPLSHGLEITAKIREAQKAVALANEAADVLQMSKNGQKSVEPHLENGDTVQLYRPQNRLNRESKFDFGTTVTVLRCEDLVVKVKFENGVEKWVHRNHCRLVTRRPDHLRLDLGPICDKTDSIGNEQSGGGDTPSQAETCVTPVKSSKSTKTSPAIDSGDDTSVTNNISQLRPKRQRRQPQRYGTYASALRHPV